MLCILLVRSTYNSLFYQSYLVITLFILRLEVGEDGLFVRTQRAAGDSYILSRVYNAAGVEDPERLQSLLSRHHDGPDRSRRGRGGRSGGRERRDRIGSNFVPLPTNKRKVGYSCGRTVCVLLSDMVCHVSLLVYCILVSYCLFLGG